MANEPLKVIIVDDEYLVRDLLKNCIDWNRYGMIIAGEAASAPEALELIERETPDILFTDICMPCMDGLEFSALAIERHPPLKVVVLTGHEEFEYAQRSIKVGVSDFLLKPINDEEIAKVAARLQDTIARERNRQDEYCRLKEQLTEHLPYLREKFFNELILNPASAGGNDLRSKLTYYGIELAGDNLQVAVLESMDLDRTANSWEEDRLVLAMQGMELVRQTLAEHPFDHCFFDNSQRVVILHSEAGFDLNELCEAIKTAALRRLTGAFCIGIGGAYQGLEHICHSYKEACFALRYKVLLGKNQLIHYSDLHVAEEREWHFQSEQSELFEFYLKAGLSEKALDLIEDFYQPLSHAQNVALAPIRVIAANLVSWVLNVLTGQGINLADIFEDTLQPYQDVFTIDTLPEMKDYLKQLTLRSIAAVHSAQNRKVNKLTAKIQEYLLVHYPCSNLSLAGVAKEFYLNPSYLSRIFKQTVGQSFVEFLTQIRMEKAIKMLKETDLKVYQIAERVGIGDPHYFSICFKKYTGMSVNDFRKKQ
ncbi:two-component system response regulator YesN [Hydrogenispora ethanolica]|uniref:Two-component system response regulator YesN n=1 Tax=Hydrogenispora ethanolica TaxID=1082276 RepID=A0A4R1RZY3_HYDET|nr:response regulator [Hydrogenispora ethanolica]TCL71572.1 two-component system response regulator YesN [Hydrogenispora ethanolica]